MESITLVCVSVYMYASSSFFCFNHSPTATRSKCFSPTQPLIMGSIGGNAREEWSSLCGHFTTEEAEFMAQLLGFPLSDQTEVVGEALKFEGDPASLWIDHQMEFLVVDDATNTTSTYLNNNLDDCFSQGTSDDNVRPKAQEKSTEIPQLPKKRPQNSGNVLKGKRSVRPEKNQNGALRGKEGEEHSAGCKEQRPSSCSSEDDFNGPQRLNGVAESDSSSYEQPTVNSKGKTRAGRGAATDPQSIYARKRRERINERLRILQNLVPNGTKVDICTMLEEAVQYVKFLQVQIKLLSSDDLWMYAPIAYNGMDIGLDLELALPKTAL